MIDLDKNYKKELDEIAASIQGSAHLADYLETEEEESYNLLKDEVEPQIDELHEKVAINDPLQLVAFEQALLDPKFEGLFLPRILGYAVLRGSLDDEYKYIRPQSHFRKVLLAIANSANFELISQRIGQTVEVGFALSSDIWITNLIAEVRNKNVKAFLTDQRKVAYRDSRSRHTAYVKYAKQLNKYNFLTASIPLSGPELKIEYRTIKSFLLNRALLGSATTESVYTFLSGLINNDKLASSDEHLEILMIIGLFFDLKSVDAKSLGSHLEAYFNNGTDAYFKALIGLQNDEIQVSDTEYARLEDIISNTKIESLKSFLALTSKVNAIGYINTEAVDIVRDYNNSNQGLSLENEAARNFILAKFEAFISALSTSDFNDYFELNKVFVGYMNLFDNEKFNQEVKAISMTYVKKLLKAHIDKRSKDYQDIKKFVSSAFLDQGFLKDKEIKELFKTKRKKPA